jgi:hypothetical protein
VKAAVSILFAFLLLWLPSEQAAGARGGAAAVECGGCCCCPRDASLPTSPLAPVPSRPAATEQLTLLLPTFSASLQLEQSANSSIVPQAEISCSAGAIPLFQRDCALLL